MHHVTKFDRLDVVLDGFGLGKTETARELAEGLMNRNWAVETSREQRVFVKQVLDVDAKQALLQHAATRALADRRLPVAAPLLTPDGRTLLEVDGGLYAVYPWITGSHVPGTQMTTDQAAKLGSALARLHQDLAAVMEPADPAMRMPVTEAAKAKASIDTYAGLLAGKAGHDKFDEYVARQLDERLTLLEAVQHERPDPDALCEPAGWAHGDFHHLNVLWEDGQISAVVDFDRLSRKPFGLEVVRSATLTFGYGDDRGLAVDQAAAFIAAYRTEMPLTDEQLRMAVHRLWWEQVCDFWQLKRHYVAGDSSCDHLFVSASALLRWWTEHREQVDRILTNR
jgi:homoserine kinase type II